MERIEEIKEEIKENSEVTEDKIEQVNKPLTKEELRKKLKHRIKSAKGSRQSGLTRKKTENIQDSLSKVSELLQNKGIDNPSQIDANLIESVMSIINKDDLNLILNKIKDDSAFKNILEQVSLASSNINLGE